MTEINVKIFLVGSQLIVTSLYPVNKGTIKSKEIRYHLSPKKLHDKEQSGKLCVNNLPY